MWYAVMEYKRKGQQSCSIGKSIQAKWDALIVSQNKIENEHHLKSTLRKQSNLQQNIQKTMLRRQKKQQNYQLPA